MHNPDTQLNPFPTLVFSEKTSHFGTVPRRPLCPPRAGLARIKTFRNTLRGLQAHGHAIVPPPIAQHLSNELFHVTHMAKTNYLQ